MHKSKKLIALIAALAILFAAFAPVSAAQSPETEAASVQRVGEVVSLRQTDSETYLLSDGTYECVVYAGDKYYKDETDALRLIDNTLIPVTASSSRAGSYKNTANAFDVYFSGSGTPEVTMQYGGSSITFSPINAAPVLPDRIDATDQVAAIGAVDNSAVLNSLTPTGNNTVTYSNAFASTDLVYVLENQMLKEYIILNGSNAPNTFSFMFTLEGLTLQTVGGTTCFVDENGTPVFSLASLYAVDSAGTYTEAVTYTCIPVKDTGNVIITVTLAEEYLSDPQRSYPVVIDPTVMISSAETADTYISSANPDANYYLDTSLRTGRDEPFGIRQSFIKFNLPSSIPAHSVTNASLELEMISGVEPSIRASRCVFSWSSSSVTYNTRPLSTGIGKSSVSTQRSSGSSWYTMDVTEIVQTWINGTSPNYGFSLKDDVESDLNHWTTFYSSDAPSPHKPELHISFTAYSGCKEYIQNNNTLVNCQGYSFFTNSWPDLLSDEQRVQLDNVVTSNQVLSIVQEAMKEWLDENFDDRWDYGTADSILQEGQWLIAMRTGNHLLPQEEIEFWDYHFWYRTDSWAWAHKPGELPSTLLSAADLPTTNASSGWDLPYTDGSVCYEQFYDSSIVYYIITE